MRFAEEERGRNGDNLNNYTASTFVCKETGDHVHYPPRQRARSPRPHHAPPSWVFSSGSDLNYGPAAATVRYRECRKNQAAEFGRTAYDGCGEFVTANDESMKCAACGCHRSFHRRDFTANCSIHRHNSGVGCGTVSAAGAVPKAKERSGGGGEVGTGTGKRFKSKFTADQKESMRNYAVKLGWKMRKESSEEVNKFCAEIGVQRVTFRNWMNNHKNSLNK